ncbi:YhdP family protein [Litchfieldella xinjiangensis]|uniref:YhdP family phospholipid transporter n=1 Tax=Litchfieldella xinjiangensis TaxID=1166948 RepID=UPI0005B989DC|nr:AsmA-like C-terminal region-containing protein [Halomonas xinjiangensis]
MSPYRVLLRWVLTFLAITLVVMALLLSGLRLLAAQLDELRPRLEALLEERFNAELDIASLTADWHGLDPAMSVDEVNLVAYSRQGALPLLELQQARLRLNTLGSLRDGLPVVEDARLKGLTLHLYQTPERTWHWPEPADVPPEFQPDDAFDLERLDFWVGLLLRQRVDIEHVRLVLHGQDREMALLAPRMLMTGDERRAHLEGEMYVEGMREATLQAALEVLPGRRGLSDFNAALQARLQVESLVHLADVLTRNDPLTLEQASGEAVVWGRWQAGELRDARLMLDVPELTLARQGQQWPLAPLRAEGQWLRNETGWQGWLSFQDPPSLGDSGESTDRTGSPLPRYWQAEGSPGEWRVWSSALRLETIAAWLDPWPLPSRWSGLIDSLSPRGEVRGISLGRRDSQWIARAALHDAAVEPWRNAPGGGPVDAWVEGNLDAGQVRFAGGESAALLMPELFEEPLELAQAQGTVKWRHEAGRTHLDGYDLAGYWHGARVQGGFGLQLGGEAPGLFDLDLAFHDVNAIETPPARWLPNRILGDGMAEWLALGVAGRIPEGRLSLSQPLQEGVDAEDLSIDLVMAIEEGRLPFAADWPALENVSGHIHLKDRHLEARLEEAESHGVWARNGQVRVINNIFSVEGELGGTTRALLEYVAHLPWGELDTQDWQGEGEISGTLALQFPLDDIESLALEIDTDVAVPRLQYMPLGVAINNVNGTLGYRHADGEGGLAGRLGARLFEGPLVAEFDSQRQRATFQGRALARGILDWLGDEGLESLVEGYFPYAARLSLGEGNRRLTLESDLQGLGIALPAPFGKPAQATSALELDADLDTGLLRASLDERLRLRWREWGDSGQGQVWFEQWPASPDWPDQAGWELHWQTPRLDIQRWASSLSGITLAAPDDAIALNGLSAVRLGTSCLFVRGRCIGSLFASAYPDAERASGWRVDLGGNLLEGNARYRPDTESGNFADQVEVGPLDVTLSRFNLDALLPDTPVSADILDEVKVDPEPEAYPAWLGELPNGRLRVATFERQGQRFGPLTAYWRTTPDKLALHPLGLTLGEVSARGELVWEAAGPDASLTRARLALDGRDVGTALERLAQPVAIQNASTAVSSQLAWPGAPWQFALERSRGSVDVELRDGRFRYLESPPAKLVGLLNIDNLLRRLRLDFSDVTRQGTAFDTVQGGATLYEGILETQGPVSIKGPATSFTLNGQVDLIRRELDQHLAVTVPLSQSLPLAALAAGAPVVGGALFIAHRLFGGAIEQATQIHYRVRGPWTSPEIALEGAE